MVAAIFRRPKSQIAPQIKALKELKRNRHIMHFPAPNPKESPLHFLIIVNLHINKQDMGLKSNLKNGQAKGREGPKIRRIAHSTPKSIANTSIKKGVSTNCRNLCLPLISRNIRWPSWTQSKQTTQPRVGRQGQKSDQEKIKTNTIMINLW